MREIFFDALNALSELSLTAEKFSTARQKKIGRWPEIVHSASLSRLRNSRASSQGLDRKAPIARTVLWKTALPTPL
jgi:hypothetical protein